MFVWQRVKYQDSGFKVCYVQDIKDLFVRIINFSMKLSPDFPYSVSSFLLVKRCCVHYSSATALVLVCGLNLSPWELLPHIQIRFSRKNNN